MERVDLVAIVGSCAPERASHAERAALASGRMLIPARRLTLSPDPVDEALALAPWAERPAGALAEFPASTRMTELIGALADESSPARLTGVVCVVDALHLFDDLRRDTYAARRRTAPGGITGIEYTAHAALTAAQLEYASTIILVNWDSLPTSELSTVMALASSLSPRARLRLDRSGVEAPEPGAPYEADQERPGWIAILNDDHDPHMTDPRVGALRYEQLRPFHPGRLLRLLNERIEPGEFGTIIRSAGFCRLATRPRVIAEWNHVGSMFSLEPLAGDDRLMPDDEILALGQDLAVIGLDLRRRELVAALDEAVLTDREAAAGPAIWSEFPDPFPAWQTADEHPR